MIKANWEGKDLFILYSYHSPPLSKNRAELMSVTWRQEPREHGRALLTGFLSADRSATAFIQPRTVCPGVALNTVGWNLTHQSLIKKSPIHLLA